VAKKHKPMPENGKFQESHLNKEKLSATLGVKPDGPDWELFSSFCRRVYVTRTLSTRIMLVVIRKLGERREECLDRSRPADFRFTVGETPAKEVAGVMRFAWMNYKTGNLAAHRENGDRQEYLELLGHRPRQEVDASSAPPWG